MEGLIAETIKWAGSLNIFVNNAARFVFGAVDKVSDAGQPHSLSTCTSVNTVHTTLCTYRHKVGKQVHNAAAHTPCMQANIQPIQ